LFFTGVGLELNHEMRTRSLAPAVATDLVKVCMHLGVCVALVHRAQTQKFPGTEPANWKNPLDVDNLLEISAKKWFVALATGVCRLYLCIVVSHCKKLR